MTEKKISSQRNLELLLLLPAILTAALAYFLVEAQYTENSRPSTWIALLGISLLFFGLHLVLRWKAPYADPILLPISVTLNGLGLVMIHRIDLANTQNQSWNTLAPRQLLWTAVGILISAIIIFFMKEYRILRKYTYVALGISVTLLVSPLLPFIGQTINGARIWVRLGPFAFQPGEIAKFTLAIFFAGYLFSNRELILLAGRKFLGLRLPRYKDMAPMLVTWAVSIGILVFQRDLGTALLYFGLFMSMVYIATGRTSWIVIGLTLITLSIFVIAKIFGHVQARFDIWLNAFDNDLYTREFGGSYQLVQGAFGLAAGGLTGTGWGAGRPFIVPFSNSDFIMTSLGEELGLAGSLLIISLFLLLVIRGYHIALNTRDSFGKLLISGLSFTLGWQCFVVIGGVSLLIPLTGLTTPFLSAGGTSLLTNWIIITMMLLVSHASNRPEKALGASEMVRTFEKTTHKKSGVTS